MMRTLVKTSAVAVDGRTLRVTYFEQRTGRGLRRFSAEILLAPGDRIILDDDSMMNLEARTARLAPATLYSRILAKATAA
jgi:type IV secretory pathway protease TraF